jgi:hypothetical protein
MKNIFLLLIIATVSACSFFKTKTAPDRVALIKGQGINILYANGAPINFNNTTGVVLPAGSVEILFRWPQTSNYSEYKIIFSAKPGKQYLILKSNIKRVPCAWEVDGTGKFMNYKEPVDCGQQIS